jgi:hypothetical protein
LPRAGSLHLRQRRLGGPMLHEMQSEASDVSQVRLSQSVSLLFLTLKKKEGVVYIYLQLGERGADRTSW